MSNCAVDRLCATQATRVTHEGSVHSWMTCIHGTYTYDITLIFKTFKLMSEKLINIYILVELAMHLNHHSVLFS